MTTSTASDALLAPTPDDAFAVVTSARQSDCDTTAGQFGAVLSASAHEYAWHLFNGTPTAELPAALERITARCASAVQRVQVHGGAGALREFIRGGGLWILGELQ